jgi:hypothetical protein
LAPSHKKEKQTKKCHQDAEENSDRERKKKKKKKKKEGRQVGT